MPILGTAASQNTKTFLFADTSTFALIGSTVLSSSQSSVSYSNLNPKYTDLYLIVSSRTDYASPKDQLLIQMNSDTTAGNYSSGYNMYDGTNASGSFIGTRTTTTSGMKFAGLTGANATSGLYGLLEVDFINFSSSTAHKTVIAEGGMSDLNATSPNVSVGSFAGNWMSTTPCNSVTLKPVNGSNFVSGSTFSLYGVTRYGGFGS